MNKNSKQRAAIAAKAHKGNQPPPVFKNPATGKTFTIKVGYVPGHKPYKHRHYRDPRQEEQGGIEPAGVSPVDEALAALVAAADALLMQGGSKKSKKTDE